MKTTHQQEYEEYLDTDYWKRVARVVKERCGYRCQVCNSSESLNAHHRTYEHRGREMDFLGDLICLCSRCHLTFHGYMASPPVGMTKAKKMRGEIPVHTPITMILTKSDIEKCRSSRNGFCRETYEALTGAKWPPKKKWAKKIVGATVTIERYQTALRAAES